MVYRLTGLKTEIYKDPADLTKLIAKNIFVPVQEIRCYRVIKKALDARDKSRLLFVYTVDVTLSSKGSKMVLNRKAKGLTLREPESDTELVPGTEHLGHRPVVVGAGPAGIFSALTLARHGYRPIVFERGQDVDTRTDDVGAFWSKGSLNTESNVQFGEGGAGAFSDGKLTTRINDRRVRAVLADMVEAGAPEEILYLHKPHVGTDRLKIVVKNLREAIRGLGGEMFFECKVTGILLEGDKLVGVEINGKRQVSANAVVMAIGHSARDTYEMLEKIGCTMEQRAFSIGVRIEHPQGLIDQAQYGEYSGHPALGAADYQLVHKSDKDDRAAYTFCMCPGGRVVAAASEENTVVTNGMSDYARDTGVANSAVVVSVSPDDFYSRNVLAGVEFQRKWEKSAFKVGGSNYHAPAQLVADFLAGKPSNSLKEADWATYRPGLKPADINDCLPGYVTSLLEEAIQAFDRKIKGFALPNAVLTGVETRTSAPVRLVRTDNLESECITGLYPAGEGAGYAGGIVSAAVDGVKVAEAIITRHRKGKTE
jgi:uncharacterized FAD-dependent dehydrogenase